MYAGLLGHQKTLCSNIGLDRTGAINYTNATELKLVPFLFSPMCVQPMASGTLHTQLCMCVCVCVQMSVCLGSKASWLINPHTVLLAQAVMT